MFKVTSCMSYLVIRQVYPWAQRTFCPSLARAFISGAGASFEVFGAEGSVAFPNRAPGSVARGADEGEWNVTGHLAAMPRVTA